MLKENFVIVGAGAWQEQYAAIKNHKSMGFAGSSGGTAPDPESFLLAVKNANVIPQELLFRFNERLLLIEPPTEKELALRIAAIKNSIPRGLAFNANDECVVALAEEASHSECPMRWLEAYAGASLAEHPAGEIKAAAADRREAIRTEVTEPTYGKLYDSTNVILRRVAYETSLAALDFIMWLQSEPANEAASLIEYLSDIAGVCYQFTLPITNDVVRRMLFDRIVGMAGKAPEHFNFLLRPDAVDLLRAGTHTSVRKFLLLSAQLSTEAGVVRRVMLDTASLAQEKIQDKEDSRVGWFSGRG